MTEKTSEKHLDNTELEEQLPRAMADQIKKLPHCIQKWILFHIQSHPQRFSKKTKSIDAIFYGKNILFCLKFTANGTLRITRDQKPQFFEYTCIVAIPGGPHTSYNNFWGDIPKNDWSQLFTELDKLEEDINQFEIDGIAIDIHKEEISLIAQLRLRINEFLRKLRS